mmetsp:Transcript_4067/g.5957  ORF Transcript_4067/g.5957 Transcript_4067/m.5957 type:complete len:241 (+) Transcript_4067:260-982(+)
MIPASLVNGLFILIQFSDLLLVSFADAMVSCSALHTIFLTATSNVLCHELGCLIKNFNGALAHLRVPRTILSHNIVIGASTLQPPIHYSHWVQVWQTLKCGIHLLQRNFIVSFCCNFCNVDRFGHCRVANHGQISCSLKRDTSSICHIFNLNQYQIQLLIPRCVEDTFNWTPIARTSLENSLNNLDTMGACDAIDIHTDLQISILRHQYDRRDVRISILGWINSWHRNSGHRRLFNPPMS